MQQKMIAVTTSNTESVQCTINELEYHQGHTKTMRGASYTQMGIQQLYPGVLAFA
jgi:hypothetical protein